MRGALIPVITMETRTQIQRREKELPEERLKRPSQTTLILFLFGEGSSSSILMNSTSNGSCGGEE